jgi:hypothetical protein
MGPAWHQELTSIGNLALPFAAPGTGNQAVPADGQQVQPAVERRTPYQAPGADRGHSDPSR